MSLAGLPLPERERRQEKVYLRTKNSRLRAFFFVAICVLMTSCFDEGDCIFTSSNFVRIDIYDAKAHTTAKQIVIDSVLIPGKVLFAGDTTSTLILPIDPNVSETEFIFFLPGRTDTLSFSYTTQSKVLSPDCGTFSYQNDLTITKNSFGEANAVVVLPELRVDFKSKVYLTNVEIFL